MTYIEYYLNIVVQSVMIHLPLRHKSWRKSILITLDKKSTPVAGGESLPGSSQREHRSWLNNQRVQPIHSVHSSSTFIILKIKEKEKSFNNNLKYIVWISNIMCDYGKHVASKITFFITFSHHFYHNIVLQYASISDDYFQ